MAVTKKIKKEKIKTESVLALSKEYTALEIAVGDNFYLLYPLSGKIYAEFMAIMRDIWYRLMSEKESKYAESVSAAKALSQNMSEVDDEDVRSAVADLMGKLTDSVNIHPLEFLSHPEFSEQISKLNSYLLEGCDQEDIDNIDIPQQARLMEACFLQNFLPFVRLASRADRIFRGGA